MYDFRKYLCQPKKILSNFSIFAVWASLSVLSTASASEFTDAMKKANYQVSSADINGDGIPDILMQARAQVVLIQVDDDFAVPIGKPVKSPTFVLMSTGNSYNLIIRPDSNTERHPAWQTNTHDLIFGDVLGNGAGSILIKGRNAGYPSAVVAQASTSGELSLVQVLGFGAIGVDLSRPDTTAQLKDQNGDGRSDLYVSVNDRLQIVLLADTNGMFHRSDDATIRAIWSAMLTALDARDTARALTYITEGSRPKYGEAFREMGDSVTGVSKSVQDFAVAKFGVNYASASVTQTIDGQASLSFITFARINGIWTIHEF